ncbi:protein of unknown function, might belong to TonB-dependent receptor [Shewanella benthica]|uniref:Uncharacterized protein n=1 Tax=Shewanella benthica TaxID=43661 RepID=A0A330M8B6_9GAMM|nr:protein of unknown function, might belong to TonB-dependent receptor [Shewanella benthica]
MIGLKYGLSESKSKKSSSATLNSLSLIRTEASSVDNYELGLSGQFADLTYEVAAYRSTSERGSGRQPVSTCRFVSHRSSGAIRLSLTY